MDLLKKSDKNYYGWRKALKGRMKHAIKRAKQRFDLKMDEYDYFYLIHQIDHLEAEWVKELPGRKELWKVRLKGVIMYAVYLPKSKTICSFLTRGMA